MRITSRIAYKEIQPQIGGIHKIIEKGMAQIKRGTFREIARASSLRDDQVWKRLSEMERKGIITNTGEMKVCSISRRPCHIWEINETNN